MSFVLGTTLLAVVTAVACALPGAFVVLRRNSMLVDAISHAVLPGIVVGYFFTHDLDSPLLIVGAAVAGVIASAARSAGLSATKSGAITEISTQPGAASITVTARLLNVRLRSARKPTMAPTVISAQLAV